MTDLDSIKQTLVNISKDNGILEMLIEFERTLDNLEIFAYKNWILGELVDGPHVGRYWFNTVWMFPMAMMPDPNAGLRLTKIGAKVSFKKGVFSKPVKVHGPEDWADPTSKRAKMAEHDVWLVTIELPIKYINRGLEQGEALIQSDIDAANAELADAYEDEMPPEEMPADDGMGGADMSGMDDMGVPSEEEQGGMA